ncbi:hypothetical protein [Serratia rubidaea]|uniref:hypothetical protein n=1 Tax=Serratia rubidaea TaxID=61652 RepID=UPI000900542B|nr:hypothetical protein [Serratia rubidaea]
MMKFKGVGFSLFIFLILYWVVAIFLIVFLLSLGIEFIFYLKNDNEFNFDFFKESTYALSKAIPGGSILGVGIWIKAWFQERKDKK